MAVYKNEYGLYSIRGKYKDYDGKFKDYHRFTGKKGFKKKTEALKVDLKLREELNEYGVTTSHQHTFETLCKQYFLEKKKALKRSSIYSEDKLLVRADELKNLPIKAIKQKHIQKILDDMDRQGYSINYIQSVRGLLSKIFKYAVEKECITRNPVDKVIKIKRPDEIQEKNNNFWTLDEFNAFIKNVDDLFYKTYFILSYFTGCRKGELIALKWTDLNFENGKISITKTCNQKEGGARDFVLTSPKTKNSVRNVKLPDGVLQQLKEFYDARKEMYEFTDEWFIFGSDKPLGFSTLSYRFEKYLKKGNFECYHRITLHGFRHSHVSFLINNGANIKAIADRVGDTVEQILKTYSHLFTETENELVRLIEDKMG